RRALAKEVADQGRILINDKVAKSSSNVVPNDQVEIRFGNKTLVIRVEQLLDTTKKDDAERMYTIISENYQQDFRK
ncbi:MAG: RNA-binding S4 domain-containing protein, partial [Pediococcus acidilactici]|nr:RNA-binding S4 domain-containing protein [Pediococcus acidilactici]